MKRVLSVFISIVFVLMSLVSCGEASVNDGEKDLGATDSKVKVFQSFLLDNAYADAIKLYNTEITGNAALEREASECFKTFIVDISKGVLSGEYDKSEAEIKKVTAENIHSSTNCDVENYDELVEKVQTSLESKVAYKSGTSLLEDGNYADAIAEFSKVLPEDSDYKYSIEKRAQAIEKYRADILDQVEACIDSDNYINAIELLNGAVKVIPDDSILLAELNTCEKNYISKVINDADKVFVDHTKYEESLSLIQSALQYYPNDLTLTEYRDYYMSFVPVNLYDIEPYNGNLNPRINDSDNMGNEYSKCFVILSDKTAVYDVGGKYNILNMKVYGRDEHTDTYYGYLEIYGDGKLLYSNQNIAINGKPFDISIDITGVSDLKFKAYGYAFTWTDCYGITDAELIRTAK